MMENTHIADGIARKLLLAGLAGLVLTSGFVGMFTLAPMTSQAPSDSLRAGSGTAAFPIDNVTLDAGARTSFDGKGNDVLTAFPINNVTLAMSGPLASMDGKGNDPYLLKQFSVSATVEDLNPGWANGALAAAVDLTSWGLAAMDVPDELPQDMDPY